MVLGNISVFSEADILPPKEPKFELSVNCDTLSEILTRIVDEGAKRPEECPESDWVMY